MPGNLMKSDAALKIIVAGAVFLVITRQAGGSARLTDRMTVSGDDANCATQSGTVVLDR
jgi:hypothetical protein